MCLEISVQILGKLEFVIIGSELSDLQPLWQIYILEKSETNEGTLNILCKQQSYFSCIDPLYSLLRSGKRVMIQGLRRKSIVWEA